MLKLLKAGGFTRQSAMNAGSQEPALLAESPKSPSSPGRLASITSKIVNLVSSPLRRTAENLSTMRVGEAASGQANVEVMLIDEEIMLRPRRDSDAAGLVRAQMEQSVSNEQFFTPLPSMELMGKGGAGEEVAGKSISQESIVEMPRSYSMVDAAPFHQVDGLLSFEPAGPTNGASGAVKHGTPLKQSLLDLEPLCPLSPDSQPKYSERDMAALRAQLEERSERQSELLQQEIGALQEKYSASLQVAQELRELLTEYEQTMAQIVEVRRENCESMSSVEQLVQDKQQLLVDLQAMQITFANLKQRYEENKTMNEQLRLHEQGLKANISALQTDLANADRRYEVLRMHAEQKLTEANTELYRIRTNLDAELSSTRAKLYKAELRVASLESTVEAKGRENTELMTICDELIQKIDSQAAGGRSASTVLASLNISRPQ